MVKTYSCPTHGEFDHECRINDKELEKCPKCSKLVVRVFKNANYSWKCGGFAGTGFSK